jgi:hypothetical protein
MTISKERTEYNLDVAKIQEARWDRCGTELSAKHTMFYTEENENHELGTGLGFP